MKPSLQTLYDKLESEYQVESHSWTFFSDFADMSDEDRPYMRYEYFAVSKFENDVFKDEIIAVKIPIVDYFSKKL